MEHFDFSSNISVARNPLFRYREFSADLVKSSHLGNLPASKNVLLKYKSQPRDQHDVSSDRSTMQQNSDSVNFLTRELSEEKEKNRNLRVRLANAESEIEALKLELQTKELETEAKISSRIADEVSQIHKAQRLRGSSQDPQVHNPPKHRVHTPEYLDLMSDSHTHDDAPMNKQIESRSRSTSPYHHRLSPTQTASGYNERPYSPARLPEKYTSPTRSPPCPDPPHVVVIPTREYSPTSNIKEEKFTDNSQRKLPTGDSLEKLTVERDKAMYMYHRLLKDFERIQSEATPESLQDRIRSLAEERDNALQAVRNLEDELQTLRVYYSLHKSLSPSIQSSGDLPRGGLLVEQLRTALAQRDELANKYTMAQENLEKQTRLVNILRKKLNMEDNPYPGEF